MASWMCYLFVWTISTWNPNHSCLWRTCSRRYNIIEGEQEKEGTTSFNCSYIESCRKNVANLSHLSGNREDPNLHDAGDAVM